MSFERDFMSEFFEFFNFMSSRKNFEKNYERNFMIKQRIL